MRILKNFFIILKAECKLFMRGELSRTTKLFQNELRLELVVLISYDSKFYISILTKVCKFSFLIPKTIRYDIRDSRNI